MTHNQRHQMAKNRCNGVVKAGNLMKEKMKGKSIFYRNKAIRKIIRLPYETHRNLLPLVINGASFSDQHVSRIKKFVSSFMNSKNRKIRFIGEMAMEYSYGPLGRNYTIINSLNNVDIDVDLICDAKAITDLIDVRDGLKCLPGLDRDDVELLIEEICCN